jgi:hypothetical protein
VVVIGTWVTVGEVEVVGDVDEGVLVERLEAIVKDESNPGSMGSKLKGNWSSQDDMVLWSAGSFHSALTEHVFPVVVVVLRSVPEHVVTVVQVVEQVSDADEETETVEQIVEQVQTGEGEQELEELDEPGEPAVELADPLPLPIGVSVG